MKSGELSSALKGKFTVKPGIGIGPFMYKMAKYDLTTITAEEAEALVKDGCDILVQEKAAPSEKK